MPQKRLYSETDIGALLKRATELQDDSERDAGRGLSLDEIEQIAGDLGIDASFLRSAAVELESSRSGDDRIDFWGGPFTVDEKCVVEGEVSEEVWEHLVQELRSISGGLGTVSRIGATREWTKGGDFNYYNQVSIGGRGDQSTIHVREHFRGYAIYSYSITLVILTVVTVVGAATNGLPPLPAVLLLGLVLLSVFVLERFFLSRWAQKRRRRTKELLSRLRQFVMQLEPEIQDATQTVGELSTDRPTLSLDNAEEETTYDTVSRKDRIR